MDLREFIASIIIGIIKPTIWLIMSLAVVYFLWNIAEVIRKSDQPDELAKFKGKAVWGIVAIFVMTSLWGLVNILINTFQPSTELNQLPLLPTSSSGSGSIFGGSGTSRGAAAPARTSGGATGPSSSASIFAPAPAPQQSVNPSSPSSNPIFEQAPSYPQTVIPK